MTKNWLERLDEQSKIQSEYKPRGELSKSITIKITPENEQYLELMFHIYGWTPEQIINRLLGNSVKYIDKTYPNVTRKLEDRKCEFCDKLLDETNHFEDHGKLFCSLSCSFKNDYKNAKAEIKSFEERIYRNEDNKLGYIKLKDSQYSNDQVLRLGVDWEGGNNLTFVDITKQKLLDLVSGEKLVMEEDKASKNLKPVMLMSFKSEPSDKLKAQLGILVPFIFPAKGEPHENK